MKPIKISPSPLAVVEGVHRTANIKKNLKGAITEISPDYFHIDIMEEGKVVPGDSIFKNPESLRYIDSLSQIRFDVHIMADNPEPYIDEALRLKNTEIIAFHSEVTGSPGDLIERIQNNTTYSRKPMQAGIALNPKTSLGKISDVLDDIDLVILMGVKPGLCGQSYDDKVTGKIRELNKEIKKRDLITMIEVDGGVKIDNAYKMINAGADCPGGLILVSGSGVYGAQNPNKIIRTLQQPVLVGSYCGDAKLKERVVQELRGRKVLYYDLNDNHGNDEDIATLMAKSVAEGFNTAILIGDMGNNGMRLANEVADASIIYNQEVANRERGQCGSRIGILGDAMDHNLAVVCMNTFIDTPRVDRRQDWDKPY